MKIRPHPSSTVPTSALRLENTPAATALHYHNGRSCEPVLPGALDDLDLIAAEPSDGQRGPPPEELVTLCEELRNRLAEVSHNQSTLVRTAAED